MGITHTSLEHIVVTEIQWNHHKQVTRGGKVIPDTGIPVPRFQQAMLINETDTIWRQDPGEIQGICCIYIYIYSQVRSQSF